LPNTPIGIDLPQRAGHVDQWDTRVTDKSLLPGVSVTLDAHNAPLWMRLIVESASEGPKTKKLPTRSARIAE